MSAVSCGCGCGAQTAPGKRFLKGHNARLRGRGEHPHGSMAKYRQGCRCESCKRANADEKTRQARARGVRTREEAEADRANWANRCVTPTCLGARTVGDRCRRCARRIASHGDPLVSFADLSPEARLRLSYVEDESGCWVWQKALSPGGYGVTWDGQRTLRAHRYAYELLVGPIPEGLHIDHLCVNPPCVNPAHLEPVTQAENNRRVAERNRA